MDYIVKGFSDAFKMLFTFNDELIVIILVSIKVSVTSASIATLAGVPCAFCINVKKFRGKQVVITVLNTLMSLPTVLIGLMVYAFLSRNGPFGFLGVLYTPWAMIIGQSILIFPLITALSLSAINSVDKRVEKTAITLGANHFQTAVLILSEGKEAILSGIIAGFGRVFSEVGISMMLGGNIRGLTRNITTAIALETSKGEFSLSIALGIVLLTVALSINIVLRYFQK